MKASFRFFYFLSWLCIFALPAAAQEGYGAKPRIEKPYRAYETPKGSSGSSDYVSGPVYMSLARLAIERRPKNFDFAAFRLYYTQTEQYDPIGEAAGRRLVALAFEAGSADNAEQRAEALRQYGDTLALHLANVDVVSRALVLSEDDRTFGDPEFFKWMRGGLMRDVMNSGDGRRLKSAYDIMTLGEEMLLMNALGVKVLETDPAQAGRVYYNMHKVQGPGQKEPYWIFTDVTHPLSFLELKKKQEGQRHNIPRQ